MRQALRASLVLSVTAVVFVSTAAGTSHQTSCPNGYFQTPVPQAEDDLRELDRIAAGLDAQIYTVQELVDLGNAIDENGDGNFCLKAVSNLRGQSGKQWAYFYLAGDNDSAAS